jgi:methionine biosynthesis protein MetW
MSLRFDLQVISGWIPEHTRVLDLGCDDGALLKDLQRKNITGYGLEIDNRRFAQCIKSDVNVIQADLNDGLPQFADQSFDFVILSQTLQAIKRPDFLIDEILRVGKQAIIAFPNFGHWQCRLQLALGGHMPVSKTLPNPWYDTANIHLCTIQDFEQLCAEKTIRILNRCIVDHEHQDTLAIKLAPNLFGQMAIYQITKTPQ